MPSNNEKIKIYLTIENEIYRDYLQNSFLANSYEVQNLTKEKVYKTVGTLVNGILLLQSDEDEIDLIEMSKKLKRVY